MSRKGYFYHINEGRRGGGKFHHRWFWDTKKRRGYRLEIATGRCLRFEFRRGGGDSNNECQLVVGAGLLSGSHSQLATDGF
jgi:urease beta subunit